MQEILLMSMLIIGADALATAVGFGLDTLMTPVLGLWLPFSQVLWLIGILHWFSCIWKMLLFSKSIDVMLVLLFGIPAAGMSFLGALLAGHFIHKGLMQFFGIFLVCYAIMLLIMPDWHVQAKKGYVIVGGGISGLCAGLFGIRGAIRAVFLTAFNMPKEVYISTVGVIGFLEDTARLSGYFLQGFAFNVPALWFIFFVPATFIGAYVGKLLVNRMPQSMFRSCIALFLLLVGCKFMLF